MANEVKQRCKVIGRTPEGLHVERPDGRCGVVQQLRQGELIAPDAEIVQLENASHDDDGCSIEMTTLVPARKGPSQVSTRRYRSGWDATFQRSTDEMPN